MFKVISHEGKFRVKEYDAEGNSVQVFEEVFATEADANAFVAAKGGEVSTPESSQPEVATPDAETKTPEAEVPAAPAEETQPQVPAEGSEPVSASPESMPGATPAADAPVE